MHKTRLMRRATMTLASIAILAGGAATVTAATTGSANQTTPTPVGEPTAQGSLSHNPCTLVTLSAAQGVVPAIGSVAEAPLGPTCIFKRGDGKPSVTLTVGTMTYAKVTQGLQSSAPVTIGKHSGVCGSGVAKRCIWRSAPTGH